MICGGELTLAVASPHEAPDVLPATPLGVTRPSCNETSVSYAHSSQISLGLGLLSPVDQESSAPGTSLVVQWLRLRTPNAGGPVPCLARELDLTRQN